MKTVMVYYCLDEKNMHKEPLGVLIERRKAERENNTVGLLKLARAEFSETVKEPSKILISEVSTMSKEVPSPTEEAPQAASPFVPYKPSPAR